MLSLVHGKGISPRRQRTLATLIDVLLPSAGSLLDVGAGDGSIGRMIKTQRPQLNVVGIDVLVRPNCSIPVEKFDGVRIPYDDNCFDVVTLIDVLHHTEDPQILLNEASRVTKRYVIIKDHHRDGVLASQTLRFMDWVGNARYGVALPYNYWSKKEWEAGYSRSGLRLEKRLTKLGLYPPVADWIFGRNLHSIVLLEKNDAGHTNAVTFPDERFEH